LRDQRSRIPHVFASRSAVAERRLARVLLRLAALDPRPSPAGLVIDLGCRKAIWES
jgi:hypothetical protein